MSIRAILPVLAAALMLAAGCGKQPEPPATPAPAPPTAEPASPTATVSRTPTPPAPPPEPEPAPPEPAPPEPQAGPATAADTEFDVQMAEIRRLQEAADFSRALTLGRQLRIAHPRHPRTAELKELLLQLREEKRAAAELPFAVEKLGASDPNTVRVAQEMLANAGSAGIIFLRRALGDTNALIAARAAEALAMAHDTQSSGRFFDLLAKQQGRTPAAIGFMKAISEMVSDIDPKYWPACYRMLVEDEGAQRRELAAVLIDLYDRVCKSSVERFEELLGAPDSLETLRAYVGRTLVTGDADNLEWLSENGGSLLGILPGLSAFYYGDTRFLQLVTNRFESVIYIEPDAYRFPLPDGRKENLAIRWRGFLNVPRDGTYRLAARADDTAMVYIDSREFMTTDHPHRWLERDIKLDEGRHSFQVDFVQGGGSYHCQLLWSGPGIDRTARLPFECLPSATHLGAIRRAARDLLSSDPQRISAATATLDRGGEPARLALRHIVSTGTLPQAQRALDALTALQDAPTIHALLARFRSLPPDDPLTPKLTEGLAALGGAVPDRLARRLYAQLKDIKPLDMPCEASALCSMWFHRFGGNAAALAALLEDEQAPAALEAHVQRALTSTNATTLSRALAGGVPVIPPLGGLKAAYFKDTLFSVPLRRVLDKNLDFYDGNFSIPSEARRHFSARWTGYLRVDTPGDYRFLLRAQDRGQLWIDDRLILTETRRESEAAASVTLTGGLHRVAGELRSWSGGTPTFLAKIEGPGTPRQALSADRLLTLPSSEMTLRAMRSIDDLVSTNAARRVTAVRTLRRLTGLSQPLLVRAVCDAEPEVARKAASALSEMCNGSLRGHPVNAQVPAWLYARLTRSPELAQNTAFARAFRGVGHRMDTNTVRALYARMLSDDKGRMTAPAAALCAYLEGACRGRAAIFNEKVGDEEAKARLQAAVEAALTAADKEIFLRAVELGTPFAPRARGLLGEYYRDTDFADLVLHRIDPACGTGESGLTVLPPELQNRPCSIRWSGWFHAAKSGQYRFSASTHEGFWVRVDNRQILALSRNSDSRSVQLDAGWHWLSAAYQHRDRPPVATLKCQPPDGGNDWRFDASRMRTAPPREVVLPLERAAGQLDAAGTNGLAEALALLQRYDPVSRPFLGRVLVHGGEQGASRAVALMTRLDDKKGLARTALRHAVTHRSASTAGPAALLLARGRDPGGAACIYARLRREQPDSPLLPDFMRALHRLGPVIDDATARAALADMRESKRTWPPQAAVLCGMLDARCGGNAETFNKLLGQPEAYAALQATVASALQASEPGTMLTAAELGIPIAPRLKGLRGEYFQDTNMDVRTRDVLDKDIQIDDDRFPHGRQRNISARWTGWLQIEKAGDYQFHLAASEKGRLWIDGKPVVTGTSRHSAASGTARLEPGLHRFRAEHQNREQSASMRLSWSGPDFKAQPLDASVLRADPWPAILKDTARAVSRLSAPDRATHINAVAMLRETDPVSRAFLRQAVCGDDAAIASHAMDLLIEREDAATAARLLAHIKAHPDTAHRPVFAKGLSALAHTLGPGDRAFLLTQLDGEGMTAPVAALCALLRGHNSDETAFDKALNHPGAFRKLETRIRSALRVADTAALGLAAMYAYPFAPMAAGLRATYFEGYGMDHPFEHLRWRGNLSIAAEAFRSPSGSRENISARLTGWLRTRAGDHTFHVGQHQRQSIWIDDQEVASNNRTTGQVRLAEGLHRVRIDYHQHNRHSGLSVEWSGPGFARRLLGDDVLYSPLSEDEVAALAGHVKALGGKDEAAMAAAKAACREFDPASRLFLRDVIAHADEPARAQAVDLLSIVGDPDTPGELFRLVRAKPDTRFARSVLAGLSRLGAQLAADEAAPLLAAVRGEKPPVMGPEAVALCAVLESACGSDANTFAKHAGAQDAYAVLKPYVHGAMQSPDIDVVLRACEFGGPFGVRQRGWRQQCFEGTAFETRIADRVVGSPTMSRDMFPYRGDRRRNVSIIMWGILNVPRSGACQFRARSEEPLLLLIDGQTVLQSRGEIRGTTTLAAGTHAVRLEYRATDRDPSYWILWTPPGGNESAMDAQWVSTAPTAAALRKLQGAVLKLSDKQDVVAARKRLLRAGGIAVPLLRAALRHEALPLAVPAAELLSWSVDEQAAPLAVEHLAAAGLQPAQRSTLLAALARLAPAITPPTARRLYALVNGAGLAADRDGLAALCAILDRTCGARKDVFNDMVGDAGAYDKLRGIVEPLLTDANPDNVAWAAEFGGPFAPRMSALSAQFFHDTAFHSRELHCRYTPQLENRRLPIKRNENICAMFSGRLNIAADGEYRFFCSADDAARLWINGRKLVDTLPTVAGEKAEGSVKLAPGQHWIQIAWKQLAGDLRLRTTWQGPGFSEQELPADRLTTTLTPRDHAALLTLIDRLNDRSRERRTQAAEEIKRYKEAGSLYLANAVRHAGGRGLGEAFRLLEEMKTPGVGDLLMERLKASADAKLNATAAAIFAANAKRLQPADAAQLHSLLVNDTAFTRIDLLGVMEALYQGPCQQKPDAFNKLVGVNNGIELIRAYLQRAAASGASSAAKTARQWLAKVPWKPPA